MAKQSHWLNRFNKLIGLIIFKGFSFKFPPNYHKNQKSYFSDCSMQQYTDLSGRGWRIRISAIERTLNFVINYFYIWNPEMYFQDIWQLFYWMSSHRRFWPGQVNVRPNLRAPNGWACVSHRHQGQRAWKNAWRIRTWMWDE